MSARSAVVLGLGLLAAPLAYAAAAAATTWYYNVVYMPRIAGEED